MRRVLLLVLLAMAGLPAGQLFGQPAGIAKGEFRVQQVDQGSVYIDGGKNAGLGEGMTLTIRRSRVFGAASGDGEVKAKIVIATLSVISVSNSSAMCQVRTQNTEIRRGDVAQLSPGDRDRIARARGAMPLEPRAASSYVLNSDTRTNVFTPPMVKMERERPQATPAPAGVASSAGKVAPAAPVSIADAARANRHEKAPASAAPSTSAAGAVPAPLTTAAPQRVTTGTPTTAAQQQAATPVDTNTSAAIAAPTMSVAEAARANARARAAVKNGMPDAVAAATPAPATPSPTVQAQPAPAITAKAEPAKAPIPKPEPAVVTQPVQAAVTQAKPSSGLSAAAAKSATKPEASPASAVQEKPHVAKAEPPAPPAAAASAPPPIEGSSSAAVSVPSLSAPSASSPASPSPSAASSVSSKLNEVTVASIKTAAEAPLSAAAEGVPGKTAFHVKYVAEDAVYIDAGKNAGLSEGMQLTIRKGQEVIADLTVASVSNTSAVCEIKNKTADIQRGDVALLSELELQKMAAMEGMAGSRKYPQVVTFSEGDPLDEEVREAVPKPPLPEINRARGRLGVDYTFINATGTGATRTAQIGGVVRVDMSRIGGSYWNLNGYWRGRLNQFTSSSQPQTVFDLVNRTYTIGFTYVNPASHWTAGVGRLYLPWAASLDTVDGGYLGFKIGSHTTIGAFAGTTPDPTSFDYNPDRRLAGSFVALEAGSFDKVRFTSTEGIAVSAIEWREDRQFVFSENGLFYKRFLSLYHSAQADIQRLPTGGTTEGLSRSFATLRVQPFSRFSIDVNHNYFRDVPTFDPSLVGTGLLDKFLFQGVSLGSRLELPGRISIYDNFGQSSKSGDPHSSFNQLYGVTVARLWKTGLRGDVRYSMFNSTFGGGNYRAASLSRSFAEALRIEVTAGQQNFVSSLGAPTNYRLLGTTVDLNLGAHYFFESGMNIQRSSQQNFEQWLMTMGYRFDSGKRK